MPKLDYNQYLKTDHWRTTKQNLFNSNRKYKCYLCKSHENLHVHHKRYRIKVKGQWKSILFNENKRDLMYLCAECHNLIHFYKLERILTSGVIKRKLIFKAIYDKNSDHVVATLMRNAFSKKPKKTAKKSPQPMKFKKMKGVASFPLKGEAGYEQFIKQVQKLK